MTTVNRYADSLHVASTIVSTVGLGLGCFFSTTEVNRFDLTVQLAGLALLITAQSMRGQVEKRLAEGRFASQVVGDRLIVAATIALIVGVIMWAYSNSMGSPALFQGGMLFQGVGLIFSVVGLNMRQEKDDMKLVEQNP